MKQMLKNKRGIAVLQMLISGAILVLIAIITVSISISINNNLSDSISAADCGVNTSLSFVQPSTCAGAEGHNASGGTNNFSCVCEQYNATVAGTDGLAAFSDYWTSIVSIIILVVIVGLFAYFRGGTGGVEVR